METDTQTRSRERKLSRANQENWPWRRLKGNFAYYKVLGEDGELCYTLTGMEEVFRCKIDRRLKKEEVRSDRSAEWRTDTPQLQQLSRSSVLVWPVPRASLKTLPEPSSGPTLRSVDLLIRFKRHWEQHMAHKCSLPPRANCWWCARALRWGGRMPRHAKKIPKQNSASTHVYPALPPHQILRAKPRFHSLRVYAPARPHQE